jgi:tetratricopeptide (TPR) repeat protein
LKPFIHGLVCLLLTPAGLAASRDDVDPVADALTEQRAVVAERPDDAGALNDLGNLLLLSGDSANAERAYREALRVDSNHVTALFNLSLIEQRRGESESAMQGFERVLERAPRHAWAHYQLGAILESQGQTKRALHHYGEAFTWDPYILFPEVNPHIIENGLVMEALLRAKRSRRMGPSVAPPLYEDPDVVRRLVEGDQSTENDDDEPDAPPENPVGLQPDAAGDRSEPLP